MKREELETIVRLTRKVDSFLRKRKKSQYNMLDVNYEVYGNSLVLAPFDELEEEGLEP